MALDGQRILVVGASSGIGREVGLGAARARAHVAFAARRADLLDQAVAEAGSRSLAITCDVRDDHQCEEAVERAAGHFGGLDAVVVAAGTSPLRRVAEADGDLWRRLLETNVVGPAMVARAALPHLEASGGLLLLLGSSAVGRPYPGLVAYAATKAALHELARGWRNEHPSLRVTTFVVGPTITGFADQWDPVLAAEMFDRWAAEGYPTRSPASAADMAARILSVVASGARVDEVHVLDDAHDGAGSSVNRPVDDARRASSIQGDPGDDR
jgi:NAD(P)-dependent dehydrogenase (short-subunit alcohol dehydrogenase family)